MRKTTEQFIEDAKRVHRDKYEYDKAKYVNSITAVEIYCKQCKEYFFKKPVNFINSKQGCPKCGIKERSIKKTSTTGYFIKKAREIHGDKYDYSLVDYKNCKTKVKIKCDCGNIFEQTPNGHLNGYGCSICGNEIRRKKCANHPNKRTLEHFIEKAILKHGDKYDYSKVKYINDKTKVEIICKTCGNIFMQKPNGHLSGTGCPKCNGGVKKTQEQFIKELKNIFKDSLDYSFVVYKNDKTKVELVCKSCKSHFKASPSHLLQRHSCPYCKDSMGERIIKIFLKDKKIKFKRNKSFDGLIDKKRLTYDFYLPEYNLLIEFNGQQHYEWVKKFQKTLHDFHRQLHHDWLKRKYARNNNIELFVISYKDNLLEVLNNKFGGSK